MRARAFVPGLLIVLALGASPGVRAEGPLLDRITERLEPKGKVARFFFLLAEDFLRKTTGQWPRHLVEVDEPMRNEDRALLSRATTFEIGMFEALDRGGRTLFSTPVTSHRAGSVLSWLGSFNEIKRKDLEVAAERFLAGYGGAEGEVATIRYTHYHGPFSLGNPSRFSSLGDKRQSHFFREYFTRKGVKGVRYEMGLLYRMRLGAEGKRLVRMPRSPLPWGQPNPFEPVDDAPSPARR